jgi:hypothetical protein
MRARVYAPGALRFTGKDALFGSQFQPQTINRYAYVLGNPVQNVDPLGLNSWWIWGLIGAGGGALVGAGIGALIGGLGGLGAGAGAATGGIGGLVGGTIGGIIGGAVGGPVGGAIGGGIGSSLGSSISTGARTLLSRAATNAVRYTRVATQEVIEMGEVTYVKGIPKFKYT